ncbi:MAG: pre-peptidase C-terminal domain-containing protein [Micromonosporaceae bacterium]
MTIDVRANQDVLIAISGQNPDDDWDLFVFDPSGNQIADSATESGSEQVFIDGQPAGRYEVRVQPFLVSPGAAYDGLASVVRAGRNPIDVEQDCLEATPAVPPSFATAPTIDLAATVLLDGVVSSARGAEVFGTSPVSYQPLGITLRSVRFVSVSFAGDDAQGLINQAKAYFGGTRPTGSDVVYVLTSKNIQAGGNTAVAGLADCIGGVQFPDRAFAVGENITDTDTPFDHNVAAKVAAHEIGHLMGGHHHYANCVEGNLGPDEPGETSPCTLMVNVVDLASLNFSTLNGGVVRGHAEAFATP